MRIFHAVVLAFVLVVASAGFARADGFITPFVGFNFGGDSSDCATLTNCEDKRTNYGVSLGSMGPVLGFETDFGWAKDFFGKVPQADNSVFTWMNSVLIGIGAGPVRPYGLVGLGLIRPHTSFKLSSLGDFSKNSLGWDIGGGVHGYFSKHVGIRGDIRHLRTVQDVPIFSPITSSVFTNQKLDFWRASIGVSFK